MPESLIKHAIRETKIIEQTSLYLDGQFSLLSLVNVASVVFMFPYPVYFSP